MTSLRAKLTQWIADSFERSGFERRFGEVTPSDRPDLADFQCNGGLGCAKQARINPRDVAAKIAAQARAGELGQLVELSIAGPGFLNFRVSPELLAQALEESRAGGRSGHEPVAAPRTVVIDYGGPNVAKAMHVGHLRSSVIGDCLARLHRFAGDTVIGDIHLGDWGTPMGMVIAELRREKPGLPYFAGEGPYPTESPVTLDDLDRLYPQAAKRYREDAEFEKECLRITDGLQRGNPGYRALWKQMVDTTMTEVQAEYDRLGIRFDLWLGESFYQDRMPSMIDRFRAAGHAVESQGALVIPVASEKEPDLPPVLLVKSGGGFLYHTSDLATIEQRVGELHADLVLYVVDARQSMHFKQLFLAAAKTGSAGSAKLVHVAFGTMNGKDGKPFRTREGDRIRLKDLIRMITEQARRRVEELGVDRDYPPEEMEEIARRVGIATLKYADLKSVRTTDYVFDLERFSAFEGNTGPYLLYATVRIQSILRKAAEAGLREGAVLPSKAPGSDSGGVASAGGSASGAEAVERALMLELLRFPDAVDRALAGWEPHHLCEYGFSLSQAFNAFYKECHILREADPARQASWLALASATRERLARVLDLLGIEVPERM